MRFAPLIGALLLLAGQTWSADDPWADLAKALTARGAEESAALDGIPRCLITARIDPALGQVIGREEIHLRNPGEGSWATVAVRTPANDPAFAGAGMRITAATWNGRDLGAPLPQPDRSIDQRTAWEWTLPRPLEYGGTGVLAVEFTTTLSKDAGFHGLLRRGDEGWCLYHWHPELPERGPDGWRLPPVVPFGDQSQTVLSHLLVRLSLPARMPLIAGGSVVSHRAGQAVIAAPLCRNLAVVAGHGLSSTEFRVGGMVVRSWFRPEHPRSGALAGEIAAYALHRYHRRLGLYPFTELDVVESAHGDGVGGVESSGLILIDTDLYDMCEALPAEAEGTALPLNLLTEAVAHEVAHQWWYGIIGNDAHREPWLDESLASWLGLWTIGQKYGRAALLGALQVKAQQTRSLPGGMDTPIDQSLEAFNSMDHYGAAVYARGSLMYQTLYDQVGDERFFAFLLDYASHGRFRVSTQDAWRASLRTLLGADDADRFAERWLRGTGLTAQDVVRAGVAKEPSAAK